MLLWALVDGYHQHRAQCQRCALEYPPCPHVQAAIREVCDWHHARALLSRAEHLRALQEPTSGFAPSNEAAKHEQKHEVAAA